MKITMYELLGLIKDGKAPKKIRVLGIDMTFIETAEWGDYNDNNGYRLSEFRLIDCLNEDVEIIEETKKIKKLKIEQDTQNSNYYIKNEYGTKCGLTKHSKMIAEKVNELIDEINN